MYKLRELERRDLETINRWRNDPELIAKLGAPFRYICEGVDERWYEGYLNSRNSTVRCTITDESDECYGLVSLTGVDWICRSAEFHIMIGSSAMRGKGLGSFAVKEILHHAFINMNLERIELTVLESNTAAQHLYEKSGFVREGMKRRSNYKNGEFVNEYIYSILRDEYLSRENS